MTVLSGAYIWLGHAKMGMIRAGRPLARMTISEV